MCIITHLVRAFFFPIMVLTSLLLIFCLSPFPTQPPPLSFIIFLIHLLIDPICVTASLIHPHFPSASPLLPPWVHHIATLRHYFFSFPFFSFLKGMALTSSYIDILILPSFIPNFISKQQEVLKNYPFYLLLIFITWLSVNTFTWQQESSTCWEKENRVVTIHYSSNRMTFALEMLGAGWRMPRKTGHEY